MSNDRAAPPDFMLLPSPDGRFTILWKDRLLAQMGPVSSASDSMVAMARMVAGFTWLSEAEARAQMAVFGLEHDAIDERIEGARRKLAVMSSAPTVMERITRIGYRNCEGQEVIRRTELRGADGQRAFVMRCGVCGHEYGAYGCDADIRRCPACQEGPPGLSIAVLDGGD